MSQKSTEKLTMIFDTTAIVYVLRRTWQSKWTIDQTTLLLYSIMILVYMAASPTYLKIRYYSL